MKALKIGMITFGSILAILYLSFLFIVPNFIKLEDYSYKLDDKTDEREFKRKVTDLLIKYGYRAF